MRRHSSTYVPWIGHSLSLYPRHRRAFPDESRGFERSKQVGWRVREQELLAPGSLCDTAISSGVCIFPALDLETQTLSSLPPAGQRTQTGHQRGMVGAGQDAGTGFFGGGHRRNGVALV